MRLIVAQQRGAGDQAAPTPRAASQFEAGLARGEGALAPAMLVAADAKGDYAFLSLKGPAFDLTDRGVAGRPAPAGLDAFVYTERGVYRSGETVHLTALLRDAQGVAVARRAADARGRAAGRRRISPHRGAPTRASAAAALERADQRRRPRPAPGGCAPSPIRSARRSARPRFLVEDYVPDRLEFDLASPTGKHLAGRAGRDHARRPLSSTARRPPALDLEGEMVIAPGQGAAGLCRLPVRPGRRGGRAPSRQPLEDLPQTDDNGKASFTVTLDKLPATSRPLEAQVIVRMAEAGGRAVERKHHAAGRRRPPT